MQCFVLYLLLENSAIEIFFSINLLTCLLTYCHKTTMKLQILSAFHMSDD